MHAIQRQSCRWIGCWHAPGLMVLLASLIFLPACAQVDPDGTWQTNQQRQTRVEWWRQAKFGMFIHWGLYAVPAGEWKTGEVSRNAYSEWIMHSLKIPVAEYEKLAGQFNPARYDAEAWVKLAKMTGMKYIVITAKHHDGFSMFDSRVTEYDIVDATPFKRDPMKALARACCKHGIKLGFYYSIDRDWHHPDAQGNHLKQSNHWDYPDESKKDFQKYLDTFAMPQIKELLTHYGPVSILWFDGIGKKTDAQNRAIIKMVRKLQPDCLINSRLGDWKTYRWGDYRSMGDNQVSNRDLGYGWENPGTTNRSYGYNKHDHRWRQPREIIRMLVGIASNGGNYLLNVGPKADGTIPEPSIKILNEVGRWMQVNGESIYGSSPVDMPQPDWGRFTGKTGKLYLHVFDWPKDRTLPVKGVRGRVRAARLLADPKGEPLPITRREDGTITLQLPDSPPDPAVSVIVMDLQTSG